MPSIPAAGPVCTVVVTVDATPGVLADMARHARAGLELFPDCEGFVGGALHLSSDGKRLVQYLQFSSEAEYVSCRDDLRWGELESTAVFAGHVAAGRASVDARTFTVLAHMP